MNDQYAIRESLPTAMQNIAMVRILRGGAATKLSGMNNKKIIADQITFTTANRNRLLEHRLIHL